MNISSGVIFVHRNESSNLEIGQEELGSHSSAPNPRLLRASRHPSPSGRCAATGAGTPVAGEGWVLNYGPQVHPNVFRGCWIHCCNPFWSQSSSSWPNPGFKTIHKFMYEGQFIRGYVQCTYTSPPPPLDYRILICARTRCKLNVDARPPVGHRARP